MGNLEEDREKVESDAPKNSPANDRPLHLFLYGALFLLGVMALLIARIGRGHPKIVEKYYTEGVGQWAGRILSSITQWWPYSVAELLLVGLILWFVFLTARGILSLKHGTRSFKNLVARGLLRVAGTLGFVVAAFYVTWAFNYDRAPLIDRFHWEQWTKPSADVEPSEELEKICSELVEITNQEYLKSFGVQDVGAPSAPPFSFSVLNEDLDKGYVRVTKRFGLHPSFAISRGPSKGMLLLSPIMSHLLISGIYTAWTGEANYNRQIPKNRLPEVIAHERAHQRGVTSEDEANFFGFMASVSADQPYTRYSGYLMAQRQLLFELKKLAPEATGRLVAARFNGVKRDVEAINEFIKGHSGSASRFQKKFNDAYLRVNNVKAGVEAYQLSSRLILAFARYNGGSCIVISDHV